MRGGRSTGLAEMPASRNWGDFGMTKYGADAVCVHEGLYHFIVNSWGTLCKSHYAIVDKKTTSVKSTKHTVHIMWHSIIVLCRHANPPKLLTNI